MKFCICPKCTAKVYRKYNRNTETFQWKCYCGWKKEGGVS